MCASHHFCHCHSAFSNPGSSAVPAEHGSVPHGAAGSGSHCPSSSRSQLNVDCKQEGELQLALTQAAGMPPRQIARRPLQLSSWPEILLYFLNKKWYSSAVCKSGTWSIRARECRCRTWGESRAGGDPPAGGQAGGGIQMQQAPASTRRRWAELWWEQG